MNNMHDNLPQVFIEPTLKVHRRNYFEIHYFTALSGNWFLDVMLDETGCKSVQILSYYAF